MQLNYCFICFCNGLFPGTEFYAETVDGQPLQQGIDGYGGINRDMMNKRYYDYKMRGVGYTYIFELSFWHPDGTSAHKNKTFSEN